MTLKRLAALLISMLMVSNTSSAESTPSPMQSATFAGGCFWCMESEFSHISGVADVTSGYTGGNTPNPTYEQVSTGETGHYEAIRIFYDPKKVNYNQLLQVFWSNIDPLDLYGQFCDKGSQYRAAVFYHTPEQKAQAESYRTELAKMLKAEVVTEILPAKEFYEAEVYHQDYYQRNAERYKAYRQGCGRDQRLEQIRSMTGGQMPKMDTQAE